jgi:7-cyano-7-deazaguanine reductase
VRRRRFRAWRRTVRRWTAARAPPSSSRSVTPGSDHYAGLESFANPGVSLVDLTSDELVAVCPITGQPDLYVVSIEYTPKDLCLESKSLKLYLNSFRNEGVFCEALAVRIRDDVAEALGLAAGDVRVKLTQKARGGITVTATS